MSSWWLSTQKYIHIRGVTFLFSILFLWSPPFFSFVLWWLRREFALRVFVLFYYILCTHLLLKIFVSHACLGEHVDSYVWLSHVLCCILQLVSSIGAQPYFYSKCLASLLFYDILLLFCVLMDIWWVMIPYLCTLYSNSKILNSAWTLGSFSIFIRTLFC